MLSSRPLRSLLLTGSLLLPAQACFAALVPVEEESSPEVANPLIPDLRHSSSAPLATGKGFPELTVGKKHYANGNTLEATQWLLKALDLGRQEAMPVLLEYMASDPSIVAGHEQGLIAELLKMSTAGNISARGYQAYFEASEQFGLRASATTASYARQAADAGSAAGKCALALLILTGKLTNSSGTPEALLREAEAVNFAPAPALRHKYLDPRPVETPKHEPAPKKDGPVTPHARGRWLFDA
jgi:TPR repeat protein